MTRDPNRRVRFALDGYSSPFSTSSSLSSPGPHTPPQLPYQPLVHIRQPYSTPSPSISPNALPLTIPSSIHDALETPTFDFDVSLNPITNPVMRDNLQLQRVCDEPATNPLTSEIRLVSRHLPWEIVIHPSSRPYVTVSDVLCGLYKELRLPTTQEEYGKEPLNHQKEIARAYYNRFERHVSNPQLMELEKSKGVKRVDFLTGAHRFRGLLKTDRPNVWYMRFKQ